MSSARLVSVAAVVLFVAVATGCGGSAQSNRLIVPGTSEITAKLPNIRGNTPVSFGVGVVCLDRAGKIKIDSATVQHPQGELRVVAFAVRPNGTQQLGAEPKSLSELGFGQSKMVEQDCDKGADEVAVEVTKPTDAIAKGKGLLLHYVTDGKRRTVRLPFAITLCPPGLRDYTKQCS